MPASVAARFWEKVALPGATGCQLWLGARQTSGYGRFWDGSRVTGAHQFAYQLAYGEIPQGLDVDHLCGARNCVAALHLEAVSHLENVRRGRVSAVQAARHAARTHCKRNHEFTPENTRLNGAGARVCRACQRDYLRTYQMSHPRPSRRPGSTNDEGL